MAKGANSPIGWLSDVAATGGKLLEQPAYGAADLILSCLKPYKLADAGGLYLEIVPTGSKLWR